MDAASTVFGNPDTQKVLDGACVSDEIVLLEVRNQPIDDGVVFGENETVVSVQNDDAVISDV